MRIRTSIILLAITVVVFAAHARYASAEQAAKPDNRVLIFSKTEGYRHDSIPVAIQAISDLVRKHNFVVEATEDPRYFTDKRLHQYQAVVFLNTTGDVLDSSQQTSLQRYVENGGGWVGLHAAADAEADWQWYGELVGARAEDHMEAPDTATILVSDRVFPATQHLPAQWEVAEGWYGYRTNPRGKVHVLMTLDPDSYGGSAASHDLPIAWAHRVGKGRAFYTGLGHNAADYGEPAFRKHLLGAIEWAAGTVAGDAGATVADNFEKVILEEELTDPMVLDIAPDGRVFVAERQGIVKVWDPATGNSHLAASLPTAMVIEGGLMGLALDPNFADDHWVYLYYTTIEEDGPNRVSRFTYTDDELDLSSEKVILEVPIQRHVCCHFAGDLAVGPDGLLYLSTGDNSSPSVDGLPDDERAGRKYYDAQRTAANTNDLRGKILRIRPMPDGSYEIPEGNLFPPGTEKARPEIYSMGHRNPWRISVDPQTNWLYYGNVGVGAGESENHGGPGYESFGQLRAAGNQGWPYYNGPLVGFREYDYATKTSGAFRDPDRPENNSPNNTGLRYLPPVRKDWIWYGPGMSEEFPELGVGGMSAAAGPVYRRPASAHENALPEYYEGSFFAMDWMRNWIKEIKMDNEGNVLSINPFLPGTPFIRPIDMAVGPDGRLYVLEWGNSFWGSNEDARLARIDYYGTSERPPLATAAAKVTTGPVSHRTGTPELTVLSPLNGGFFDWGQPVTYRVEVTDSKDTTIDPDRVKVKVLLKHDTHEHVVTTLNGSSGTFRVASDAHAHHPNLQLTDRSLALEFEYTDEGSTPLTTTERIVLRPRRMEAEHAQASDGVARRSLVGHPAMEGYGRIALIAMDMRDGDHLAIEPIDLTGIHSATLLVKPVGAGRIELRLDAPDGSLLASARADSTADGLKPVSHETLPVYLELLKTIPEPPSPNPEPYEGWYEMTLPLTAASGTHGLYVVFESDEGEDGRAQIDWIGFNTEYPAGSPAGQ